MSKQPSIFIGSASEALPVAEAIQERLKPHAQVLLWKSDVFAASRMLLPHLLENLSRSDFVVMVGTPDDMTTSRGRKARSPRDNVVFELGVAMGRLGQHRVFSCIPTSHRRSFRRIWKDSYGCLTRTISRCPTRLPA